MSFTDDGESSDAERVAPDAKRMPRVVAPPIGPRGAGGGLNECSNSAVKVR